LIKSENYFWQTWTPDEKILIYSLVTMWLYKFVVFFQN
jgi:hypothetical protein